MKLKQKLLMGFLLLTILIALVGSVGIYSAKVITTAYNEIADETAPALLALGNIKAEVLRMQVEALSGDLGEFTKAKESLEKWEHKYEIVAEDEKEMQFVEEIEKEEVAIFTMGLKLIEAKTKNTDQQKLAVLHPRFEALEERFEKVINAAIELEDAELEAGDKFADEVSTNLIQGTIIILAIAILASVGFSFFFSNKISTSITEISTVAEKYATGNLSERIQYPSNDEIGDLGRAFNVMAEKLEKTITIEVANELRAFNQQLTASQQQLKASNQQLKAYQQQLQASNQQLSAKEHALRVSKSDIKDKLTEMERFNKVMVGRENVMLELKAEINILLEAQGNPKKYTAPDEVKKT